MKKTVVLWTLAVALTLASAAWQRRTGPTYPVRGAVTLAGARIPVELERSHGGETDQPVRIVAGDPEVTGEVAWRRFPGSDPWSVVPMVRDGETLEAFLPHQPPAGKLEYQIRLARAGERAVFPERPAVTRFKGGVSAGVLIPHIVAMFVGMLLSTAAGLGALLTGSVSRRLVHGTLTLIAIGGLVLGPLVQKAAFDAYWTGVPFGYDLTDNKTLIAAVAWGWAVWRVRGQRGGRWEVVAAAIVTLLVFAIPHSTWGSQLNWDDV